MGDAQIIGGSEFSASTATKAAIFRAGGGTLVLAIAMLEDKTLLCDYNFGDNKEEDAANFGIFKMNWYMIRQCASGIALIGNRIGPDVWSNTGPAINADAALATQILLEAMDKWSIDAPDPDNPVSENFWAGHRWGETGLRSLAGTDWNDILRYYRAVKAIEAQCNADPTVWTTSIRYWVDVPPI